MLRNNTFYSIKKICTFLLLASFFLPMARSCSEFQIPPKSDSISSEIAPWFVYKNNKAETYYPWDIISGNNLTQDETFTLLILCYLWPLPFLWFQKKIRSTLSNFITLSLELLICSVASYLILIMGLFGGLLYGGYISLTILGIYFFTSLSEIIYEIKILIRNNSSTTR